MAGTYRHSSWAWLVPAIALISLPDHLRDLGDGSHDRGIALSLVIGVVTGTFWYWRYPRPLADRLLLLATFSLAVTAMVVLGALFSAAGQLSLGDAPSGYAAFGVLTALVLAEHFHHVVIDRRGRPARLAGRSRRTPEPVDRDGATR